MKLAFCIFKYFPFGGVERDFMRVLREALSRGHEVDVYTMSWAGGGPDGVSIYLLPIRGMTNHARAKAFSKEILRIHRQLRYDAVVGFNKMEGVDFCFIGDRCLRERVGILKRFLPRYRVYLKLESAVFSSQSKTKVMLLTSKQKEDYQKYYAIDEDRVTILPAGLTYYPPEHKESRKDGITLLFVASKFHNKGLDRAIRALASLKRSDVILKVAGGDEVVPYRKLAAQLGVEKQLVFLGAVTKLHDEMVKADLLVHPARVEAAGMVLLEALIAGLPVLTTAICGYAFHVTAAKAGVVLDEPFQQTDYNDALHEMLDGLSEAQWRDHALAYAAENDFYSMAERAVDFIEKRSYVRHVFS